MDDGTKRRLTLLATGVLLAAVATTLARFPLVAGGVADADPYAVAVGLAVAMPLLLAGAYPRTEAADARWRAVLVLVEAVAGVGAGVGAVALVVTTDLPDMLAVGAAAAATYVGATAARAVVLGRPTGEGEP